MILSFGFTHQTLQSKQDTMQARVVERRGQESMLVSHKDKDYTLLTAMSLVQGLVQGRHSGADVIGSSRPVCSVAVQGC